MLTGDSDAYLQTLNQPHGPLIKREIDKLNSEINEQRQFRTIRDDNNLNLDR